MVNTVAAPRLQVHVHGPVRTGLVRYARAKVAAALRYAPRPVLFVRLTVERSTAHGVYRPYTIRVHADVNGHELYARASAATLTEAADLVRHRLRTLLIRAGR
ncbi:hypothetical protein WEI85_27505 [Actinomycetes bacterium KLBMP 9797]